LSKDPEESKGARFTTRAAAYAQHRPGYPPGVFHFLFENLQVPELIVADIGAGTGISSTLLASLVARVIAIEPNAQMRSRAQALANVEWHEGSAEETGLEDKSVDVAAAFQAFHWFDAERAFREFRRIARRRVAMVQYERDESRTFSAGFAAMIRPFMLDDTEALRMRMLQQFAVLCGDGLHRAQVPFVQTLGEAGVIGRIDSSSYLPRDGTAARELRDRARELFSAHERDGLVDMDMTAYVLYADVA
jgi:ubiquinone/menaquinone biosynthesis C-methylase UbiE